MANNDRTTDALRLMSQVEMNPVPAAEAQNPQSVLMIMSELSHLIMLIKYWNASIDPREWSTFGVFRREMHKTTEFQVNVKYFSHCTTALLKSVLHWCQRFLLLILIAF